VASCPHSSLQSCAFLTIKLAEDRPSRLRRYANDDNDGERRRPALRWVGNKLEEQAGEQQRALAAAEWRKRRGKSAKWRSTVRSAFPQRSAAALSLEE